ATSYSPCLSTMLQPPLRPTLFPYTTLFRSERQAHGRAAQAAGVGRAEEVIKEHPVLLNRAPTLHRLGIQAFEPVLRRCSVDAERSEEHTSELQSQSNLVCRLLLEKKKKKNR